MTKQKQNSEERDQTLRLKDPDAFNHLVKAYSKPLYWHLKRMLVNHEDCNDILQDTFLKAWKGMNSFRGDSEIYTWLYRIATNEALNFLKKKSRHYSTAENNSSDYQLDNLEADPYFNGNSIQKKLRKAIFELPAKQQAVFNMKYFDELKYEQISEILDTSVGALKASYHHAVKKIKNYIQTED